MDSTGSKGIGSFFGKLGPGLLLAATAIGASHLVMSPQAGSLFGFQLLWLVTLTHLFKYHAFEFGPRYAAATGESLIAGYMRVPGPKGWALWILLAGTVAQGVGVLAGVVSIAAAVLFAFVGQMSLEIYTALVIVTILGFLFLGGYGWLDFLNKIMMTVLFLATAAVLVPAVPPPAVLKNLVVPSIPPGSIPLIAAILGWMPTGIDVSIWHSLWTLQKHPELVSKGPAGPESSARKLDVLRLSLTDMRIGYVLSFVVASVFLVIAATFLHGTSRQIAGVGFAESLAAVYTEQIGSWMYIVFMVAAFSAMYSTTYTVIDGFSRSFAETAATLRPNLRAKWWTKLYWGFVLATASFAYVVVVTVGNPVRLVTIVAILSLCVAPLYYGLNYYCVTRFITQDEFRPKTPARVTALLGIVVMFLATLLYAGSKLKLIE
ncbi:MAG: Nramp family divalent metal transporter [Planctomycetota bacterium]